jgi:hypothetical protein
MTGVVLRGKLKKERAKEVSGFEDSPKKGLQKTYGMKKRSATTITGMHIVVENGPLAQGGEQRFGLQKGGSKPIIHSHWPGEWVRVAGVGTAGIQLGKCGFECKLVAEEARHCPSDSRGNGKSLPIRTPLYTPMTDYCTTLRSTIAAPRRTLHTGSITSTVPAACACIAVRVANSPIVLTITATVAWCEAGAMHTAGTHWCPTVCTPIISGLKWWRVVVESAAKRTAPRLPLAG